jgi:hypothetical protein
MQSASGKHHGAAFIGANDLSQDTQTRACSFEHNLLHIKRLNKPIQWIFQIIAGNHAVGSSAKG